MLLNCQNSHCNSFNYSKSIFWSTYGAEEVMINRQHYHSGIYIIFAFDTYMDGLIRSSAGLNNVAYSILPKVLQLTAGSQSGIILFNFFENFEKIHTTSKSMIGIYQYFNLGLLQQNFCII